jgi:hypothetical protein
MFSRLTIAGALAPLLLVTSVPGQAQYPQRYQQQPLRADPVQAPWQPPPAPFETVAVYRVSDPRTGEYRFTDDPGELNGYVSSGFQDEGVAFRLLPDEGPDLAPLYRLALENGATALGIMTRPGYKDPRGPIDKTLGLLSIKQQRGWAPLYEWYNPRRELWFYTTDPRGEGAKQRGYRYEHIVGYVLPAS